MKENELQRLSGIPKGSRVIIMRLDDVKRKGQLVRLGIAQGEFIRCLERLPGGTMVVEKNRREIAIGASLAKSIIVTNLDGEITSAVK
jgi:Fe2+ transport system protein FeoA